MLPNLVVIGAMKAATSSLHHYLAAHPEIQMSSHKELDFFVEEKNWSKGLDWYRSNFRSDAKVRGESSPNYTALPVFQGVAGRMHSVIPNARLIYLVRDPVERMISHYIHSVERGRERRTLEEALADRESLYYSRSKYHMQIAEYLEHFDRSSIFVVSSERLLEHRSETLADIFGFLRVDEHYASTTFDEIVHASSSKRKLNNAGALLHGIYRWAKPLLPVPRAVKQAIAAGKNPLYSGIPRPQLSAPLREQIADCLADDLSRLRGLTGKAFAEWSV